MTNDDKALVEHMRETLCDWEYDEPRDKWRLHQHDYAKAAERIEALSAEVERLRDIPNHIWAEARDSEWDEGFNYAVKLFRAALGEQQ